MTKYWAIKIKKGKRYAGSDDLTKKKADRKYYNKKESWEKSYRKSKGNTGL